MCLLKSSIYMHYNLNMPRREYIHNNVKLLNDENQDYLEEMKKEWLIMPMVSTYRWVLGLTAKIWRIN
jgi:hypothetical protein